jgi:polyisoprenoid-binding protein YceI
MKRLKKIARTARVLGALTLIVLGSIPVAGQSSQPASEKSHFQFALEPESRLWLEGDSTLHTYASTATKMELVSEFTVSTVSSAQSNVALMLKDGQLKTFELTIDAKGLKSGKESLDKNMYNSLKADTHPAIIFRLAQYEIAKSTVDQKSISITVKGHLIVAGKEKEIDLSVEALPTAQGIQVLGAKELLMTDFGIKPPTAIFGALKTDNKVVIRFDLLLRQESLTKQNAAKKEVR